MTVHVDPLFLYVGGWVLTTVAIHVWSRFNVEHGGFISGAILGAILSAFSWLVRWYT